MDAADSPRPAHGKSACLFCRQRKVACDRLRPSCSFCRRNEVDCKYGSSRKPGLRAGFVTQLEERVGELEKRVRSLESTQSTGSSVDVDVPQDRPSTALPPSAHSVLDTPASFAAFHEGPVAVTQAEISAGPNPLSPPMLADFCVHWFERYHPWFPILHQPSLLASLERCPDLSQSELRVCKAIVAITVKDAPIGPYSVEQRTQWADQLYEQVIIESMRELCLQSIQALLILSNNEYGAGRPSQFWNLVALCKRMCVHLGLRDLVATQGENFNRLSAVQPRMLPLPHSAIDREERLRAFWMTEVLDNISTLGAAWNLGVSLPEPSGVLPCSDSIWAFPEHIINVWSFGAFYFSSAFSLCIILATNELWHVHRFLQQSIDISIEDERARWHSEAQQIDERLTTWRGDFVAAMYRLLNAEHAQEERAEMDPNIVLTNGILDCAVIVLFQRTGPFPDGVESDRQAWPYATNRCLYACDDLAAKIRLIHDHEIEITSPHLAFSVFVAARFYLVYSRAVDADIPRNLQILAYALHLMARRWPLAKRYETLVRAGVADHRTPVLMSSLPPQFFDLRYSTLDIDETLRLWADNHIAQFGDSASSVAAMST